MIANEYLLLLLAVERGVATGFKKIAEKGAEISEIQRKDIMEDAVHDSFLEWFHVERPKHWGV